MQEKSAAPVKACGGAGAGRILTQMNADGRDGRGFFWMVFGGMGILVFICGPCKSVWWGWCGSDLDADERRWKGWVRIFLDGFLGDGNSSLYLRPLLKWLAGLVRIGLDADERRWKG